MNNPGDAPKAASVDAEEIAHFAKDADTWWDETGPFAPLHGLNPVRIGYLRDRAVEKFGPRDGMGHPLSELEWLDVGCGGGLLAEPLTRLGAGVTGIDAGAEAVAAARAHADLVGLNIDYECRSAESLAAEGRQFDCVSAMEVVEHVAEVDGFLATCRALTRDGGLFFFSTLNRTAASLLLAKVGAEYIFRVVPPGSHDWRKFLRPAELSAHLHKAGFRDVEFRGLVYEPLSGKWKESGRLAINYMGVARA